VLDEYQKIVAAEDAERFVEALVAASPIQALIASRQRPSWTSARRILYREVLELDQTALAMDSAEAAQVLSRRTVRSASGLAALANGWPAVIGLASVSPAEIEDQKQVPESLYRFFAEEVFGALGNDVQAGLMTLAVAPVLDRKLAAELLGSRDADAVCTAALDVGMLVERGTGLDLHPLARSFLDERARQAAVTPSTGIVRKCLQRYITSRDWDAAFDLIALSGPGGALEKLMFEALDDLLDSARLSTIETWTIFASDAELHAPVFALARSEVALRLGRYMEAQAFAETAAEQDWDQRSRALAIAGRAAHLASQEEEALELFRLAESAATTDRERRDALWGQVMCAIELELPEAASALELLRGSVRRSDHREVVRAAMCTLSHQMRLGSLDLAEADRVAQIVPALSDPLVESGFQNVYASALGLTSRYEEALEVSATLLTTLSRYKLDFAKPYAYCWSAVANSGLRRWASAHRDLNEARAAARTTRNSHGERAWVSALLRLLAQQGRYQAALALQLPDLRSTLPSDRVEVLCSRAIVLASVGRIVEARAIVEETRGSTCAIEPRVLGAAADAICAVKARDGDAMSRVAQLEDVAFSTGAVDLLVTAYRTAPELLPALFRTTGQPERLCGLIERARDSDLAHAAGYSRALDGDPRSLLSRREHEVYELLCQGLTNRQIAELLFISESTVKVHVHHIYDKLGVRSRTALTVRAALERSAQATSAIEDTDVGVAS
jgi:ATP/maltotriose-dependent transcriptional regulator MalT